MRKHAVKRHLYALAVTILLAILASLVIYCGPFFPWWAGPLGIAIAVYSWAYGQFGENGDGR